MAGECELWTSGQRGHQQAARDAFGPVPLFTWLVTTCGEPLCVARDHLVTKRPLRLAYPDGVCVYCGVVADSNDHLLPKPYTGASERIYVVTVPACRRCNSAIGDAYVPNITQRRRIAHRAIWKRHAALLRTPEYTDEELAEFGPNMRRVVLEGMRTKEQVTRCLEWPEDPLYDLMACVDAGIDDPVAIGILDANPGA